MSKRAGAGITRTKQEEKIVTWMEIQTNECEWERINRERQKVDENNNEYIDSKAKRTERKNYLMTNGNISLSLN